MKMLNTCSQLELQTPGSAAGLIKKKKRRVPKSFMKLYSFTEHVKKKSNNLITAACF